MAAQRLLVDLRQLYYFIAAAEKCSMSAAAERCGVSQPTLSAKIHQLELELGVPLFRRTPFGLQATAFAERLYRHVVPILRDAADGMRSLRANAARFTSQGQPDDAPRFMTDAVPDIRQLRYFLCAFQEHSMTRAAAKLHIAQPALSARIKTLEAFMGGDLFERTSRGLLPTAHGRRVYSIYEPIVRAVDATRSSIGPCQSVERRILRIGFIAALDDENLLAKALTAAVSAWRERYADVELRVVEGGSSALLDWVSAGNVDVAFVGDMDGGAAFASYPLSSEPLSIVTSSERPLCRPGPIQVEEIASLDLVLPSSRNGLRAAMNRQFAASGIVLKPKLELDSMASALRLVRAGGWATCLPASAVRDRVQLQTHQIVSPVITCSLTAVHAREHAEISWERKFINLIADQLPH